MKSYRNKNRKTAPSKAQRRNVSGFSNEHRKQLIRSIVEGCGVDLDKPDVSLDIPLGMDIALEEPIEDVPYPLEIDAILADDELLHDELSDLYGQDLKGHDGGDGHSVKSKLSRTAQLAQSLADKLNDADELPNWVIGKSATVLDRVEAMYDYLDYKMKVEESMKVPALSNILFEQEEKEDDDTSKKQAKEDLLNFANKGLQEIPANQVDALMDQFKGLVDMAVDKKLAAKEEKLEKKMDQESGNK